MPDSLEQMLGAWHDFYLLAGTTAGALVGLQFVAASLAATLLPVTDESSVETFVTPTIVHFTAVLVVAALVLMPPVASAVPLSGLGLLSLAGTLWLLPRGRDLWRRRRQQTLTRSRFIWHFVLPLAAYLLILSTPGAVLVGVAPNLLLLALASILLLVIGIHNAWDLFVWTYRQRSQKDGSGTPA